MDVEDDDWGSSVALPPRTPDLKIAAHELFDPIWRDGLTDRTTAYRLLATIIGVPEDQAHMRVMTREHLERMPEYCSELRKLLRACRGL